MDCNHVEICGHLLELDALRHTPAGVPTIRVRIAHNSTQLEAGIMRKVECEINAVALADIALRLAEWKLGDAIKATGFLAKKSYRSSQLILHINNLGN